LTINVDPKQLSMVWELNKFIKQLLLTL